MIDAYLTELLAAAVDAVVDPPERQYVAHGDTFAHDCELLVSRLVTYAFERTDPNGCLLVPVAVLEVRLLRCYPKLDGGRIPAPAEIGAAATALAADGQALMDGIADAVAAGTLFDDTCCADVTLDPGLAPISPEGGYAGWTLTLTLRL